MKSPSKMNCILEARENRKNIILREKNGENVILTLKINVPGENKRVNPCLFLVNLFSEVLKRQFCVKKSLFFDEFDGFWTLFVIESQDPTKIKLKTIEIENNHPLGRFIDIDVYYNEQYSISRAKLGIDLRKCYLCDNLAAVCSRNQTHSNDELLSYMMMQTTSYIEAMFSRNITKALLYELDLHPKFGLVTKYSNGSHRDMNYDLMRLSIDAITPYLVRMAIVGFTDELDNITPRIKELGRLAEAAMLKTTLGINTYKGMIYCLGFMASALGYYAKTKNTDVYQIVKYLAKDELKHFDNLNANTFGETAYKKYGFTGARGEVASGFKTIQNVYFLIEDKVITDETLTMLLINIICSIEDTVLLKRCKSMEKYNQFKNIISSIKNYDIDNLLEVTNKCIENNVSFGGASDILATTILLKLMKEGLW